MTVSRPALVHTTDTPHGPFTIIANESGQVLASGWNTDDTRLMQRIHHSMRPDRTIAGAIDAAQAVTAYYDGDTSAVGAVVVLQHGTELQQRGWAALREIAPGRPVSYAEFAGLLDRPNAARVAAAICARNATGLFVPCHRVLRTDGTLGGFAWGTDVKQALLTRERSKLEATIN